jgi:hypothetical protein
MLLSQIAVPDKSHAQGTLPEWGRALSPAEKRTLEGRVATLSRQLGLRESTLRAIARAAGQKAGIGDFNALVATVERNAELAASLQGQVTALQAALAAQANPALRDPARNLLATYQLAFDEGRLDDAAAALDRLDALRRANLSDAGEAWDEVIASRANLAEIRLDYGAASQIQLDALDEEQRRSLERQWRLAVGATITKYNEGRMLGSAVALKRALGMIEERLFPLAPASTQPGKRRQALMLLGDIKQTLSARGLGLQFRDQAIADLEAALAISDAAADPIGHHNAQLKLLEAQFTRAAENRDSNGLRSALTAYGELAMSDGIKAKPTLWLGAVSKYANLLVRAGDQLLMPSLLRSSVNLNTYLIDQFGKLEAFELEQARTEKARALRLLATMTGDPAIFEEARAAAEQVLTPLTREANPISWGGAMLMIADLDKQIGEGRRDRDRLLAAIARYDQVSAVFSKDDQPSLWATSKWNAGTVYKALFELSGNLDDAIAAEETLLAARQFYTPTEYPAQWASITLNLGNVFGLVGQKKRHLPALDRAVTYFDGAMTAIDRSKDMQLWITVRLNRAAAYHDLSKLGQTEKLDLAIADIREVRAFQPAATLRTTWLFSGRALALNLIDRARIKRDCRNAREAVQLLAETKAALTEADKPRHAEWVTHVSELAAKVEMEVCRPAQ